MQPLLGGLGCPQHRWQGEHLLAAGFQAFTTSRRGLNQQTREGLRFTQFPLIPSPQASIYASGTP